MKKKKLFLTALLLSLTLGGLSSCGSNGVNGKDGLPGEKGETGEKGSDGINGKDGSSVLTGDGVPDSSLGNDGDSYINLNNYDYYVKEDGVWVLKGNIKGEKGNDGVDGKDGIDGKDGQQGEKGSDGADGNDGIDGKDGKSILSGEGAPNSSLGSDGDSYIDTSNYDFYVKKDGSWTKTGNIKGETGSAGAAGIDGNDGLPGEKGETGEKGNDGSSFRTGNGEPSSSLGSDGDSYLDLSTYDIYVKENGEWKKNGNIKGEDGTTYYKCDFLDGDGSYICTTFVEKGKDASYPSYFLPPSKSIITSYGDTFEFDWNGEWEPSLNNINENTTFRPVFDEISSNIDNDLWNSQLTGRDNFSYGYFYDKDDLISNNPQDVYYFDKNTLRGISYSDSGYDSALSAIDDKNVNYYFQNPSSLTWEKHVLNFPFDSMLKIYQFDFLNQYFSSFEYDEEMLGYYCESLTITDESSSSTTYKDILIRFIDGKLYSLYYSLNGLYYSYTDIGNTIVELPSESDVHNHTFSSGTWTYDDSYHWRTPSCECVLDGSLLFGMNLTYGLYSDSQIAQHNIDSTTGKCSVCGYNNISDEQLFTEALENIKSYTCVGTYSGASSYSYVSKEAIKVETDASAIYYYVNTDAGWKAYEEIEGNYQESSYESFDFETLCKTNIGFLKDYYSKLTLNEQDDMRIYMSENIDSYSNIEIKINSKNEVISIHYSTDDGAEYNLTEINNTSVDIPSEIQP